LMFAIVVVVVVVVAAAASAAAAAVAVAVGGSAPHMLKLAGIVIRREAGRNGGRARRGRGWYDRALKANHSIACVSSSRSGATTLLQGQHPHPSDPHPSDPHPSDRGGREDG